MSKERAMAFQTVKSLNSLFKVCSCTNASRSYCSISSFKAIPFVQYIRTLSSAATGVFRETKIDYEEKSDGVYGGNSFGIQRNLSGVYGQKYNHNSTMNSGISEEVIGGGNDQYLKSDVRFQENQGNYNMGEDGLYPQSQYNAKGSYSGFALTHQQSISSGSDSGVVSDSQPDEKSFEDAEETRLLASIEVLDAFCKDGKIEDAVKVLDLLEQNNVSVDLPRYIFLMKSCGENQALKEAKYVHHHLTRSIPYLDVYICNKILEMYSKCGSMEDAYKVFDKMLQRNFTSWDTMITGLATNGHGEDAIEMFTEFKRAGLKPDNQMFFGVFSACSVLGDMREGLLHFESMIKTYNLVPSMDHYVSVVDMLGSSGYINEALEFIEKMTIEPSVQIWKVMMNQCRIHGDLELEDRCAQIVDLIDPLHLEEHSKEGLIPIKPIKPSDVVKENKKKKNLFEIKNRRMHFSAGDTSQPDHEKLYSQLRGLMQSMKEVGHVPQTKFALHDIDEECKENALLAHSERLALCRSLFTTPPRASIIITKNLCACGDCHEAFKIISKLVGRKITSRDTKRFHHFEDGVCACGDYW